MCSCKLSAKTTFFTETVKMKIYKWVGIGWYFPTDNFKLLWFEELSFKVFSYSKSKYLLLKKTAF